MEINEQKKKFDPKWLTIGACFLMVFVCLGFCSSSKSIYLAAITEALGIKRSLFSINDSCRYVTTAIVNLFFGRLLAKFGSKKLILAGFISLMISTFLYSVADNIAVFCVGGCFLGLGLSWTTTTMVGSVVHRLCPDKSGTIMGFVLAANGVGAAVSTQIVSPIIYEEGNPFGYRNAYRLVVLILAAVTVLMMIFFKDRPLMAGEPAKKKKKKGTANWPGIPSQQLFKRRWFYLAIFCVFASTLMLQSMTGISSAHLKDIGIDPAYVATVASCHSLALTAFKFLTGIMYDKFGLKITMIINQIATVIASLLLALVMNSALGRVMAICYGVISSLGLPLETIMVPLIADDLFGNHSYDKMLGILISVNTLGSAVGTPLINLVYDQCGTYKPILVVYAVAMVFIMVLFQLVLRSAHRERAAIIAAAEPQA